MPRPAGNRISEFSRNGATRVVGHGEIHLPGEELVEPGGAEPLVGELDASSLARHLRPTSIKRSGKETAGTRDRRLLRSSCRTRQGSGGRDGGDGQEGASTHRACP